ncbi:YetF domain-containing protein [Neomesorhizobium albiziae]|nr:YetF domain-containing protein [Mesorhizobium albiziae]
MFFGDEPPLFLAEIAIRTIIIYVYTLLLIRWIGSRSIGQLSMVEFLLVIALGSAVGDAMFYPDVPLVHCMVVITMVVLLDKFLSLLVSRSAILEDAIEGKSIEVVRDGLICWKELERMNIGHDELFEQLRLNKIERLGEVRGAYFETNGLLSVFRAEAEIKPESLSIMPPWDVSKPRQFEAGSTPDGDRQFACIRCATVVDPVEGKALSACPRCGGETWHRAAPPPGATQEQEPGKTARSGKPKKGVARRSQTE